MMEYQHVPVTICFNKKDLITPKEQQELKSIYEPAGYRVLFTSTKTGEGIDEIKHILEGRTTTVAGPRELASHLSSTVCRMMCRWKPDI